MSKSLSTPTLKTALFNHSNNYKFDPSSVIAGYVSKQYFGLSVIIPYYEAGEVIRLVLHHLYNSLTEVRKLQPDWKYEVVLIDDGSVKKPVRKVVKAGDYPSLKILINSVNVGRTSTRNRGLKEAKNNLCLFMDSDILIDNQLILNHLKIHSYNRKTNKNSCITPSFFCFADQNDPALKDKILYPARVMINDWRLYCLYQATWIGCDDDKKFIGQEIRIVQDTNYFKNWKGMYKAWALSNMVLGGFFMVSKSESLKVGGFDESFKNYGFTETSLPTKLIAIRNNFVIPVITGGGIHIEDKAINIGQAEKDKIFRQRHQYYFNTYLNLSVKEAIKN